MSLLVYFDHMLKNKQFSIELFKIFCYNISQGGLLMKKILFLFVLLILLIPNGAQADYLASYHSYGVTEEEKELMAQEESVDRGLIDELVYRMVEKDTRDAVDYVILATIITLMVIVIILMNRRVYVIPGGTSVFADEEPKKEVPMKSEEDQEKVTPGIEEISYATNGQAYPQPVMNPTYTYYYPRPMMVQNIQNS